MITTTTNLKNTVMGAVDTSKLRVTVNFGGSIGVQDISDHVIDAGGRAEETYAIGQGPNPNDCSLTLINDDGRFSPRNTNSPYWDGVAGQTCLTPNKPITISVVAGSDSIPIFTGYTSVWNPSAKTFSCSLRCFDAALILKRNTITSELVFNPSNITAGVTWNWVLERAAWLAGIRWDWVTTYDATFASSSQVTYNSDGSTSTSPITVVPNNTLTTAIYRQGGSSGTIAMRVDIARSSSGVALMMPATNLNGQGLDAIAQIAQVVDGRVYFDAAGALRVRSRMYVGDASSPADTITVHSLDDSNFSQNFEGTTQVPMVNSVTVTATPLMVLTNTDGSLKDTQMEILPAGGYITFSGNQTFPGPNDPQYNVTMPSSMFLLARSGYPSPSNLQITSSLSTDRNPLGNNGVVLANGYPIYSTNQVQLKFVNNNSQTVYVTGLRLTAQTAQASTKIQAYAADSGANGSITLYGKRDQTVNNDGIPNNLAAVNLANWLVASSKDLKDVLTTPLVHGMPWLELGDTVSVSETITNTVPVATNYVIRTYTWKYTLDSFTQSFVLVPPAPAFTLQTGITNGPQITNSVSGSKSDSVPKLSVTTDQIGLQTLPAFSPLLTTTKQVPLTGVANTTRGVAFYKGFIWTVSTGGEITRTDAVTLGSSQTWVPLDGGTTGSAFEMYDCKVHGRYLFIGARKVSSPVDHRILWFDMDNPGTTLNTNWGSKIVLSTLTTNPIQYPNYLFVAGSQLYISGENTAGTQGRFLNLDISTNTLVGPSLPAGSYNLATSAVYAAGQEGEVWTTSDNIWVVSRGYDAGTALTANASAGQNTVKVPTSGFSVGQPILLGDNLSAEPNYVQTIVDSATLTTRNKLANNYTTANGATVYKAFTTINRFNSSSGTMDVQTVLNDGVFGGTLEWDGAYLYVGYYDKVVKYAYSSGTLVKIAELVITASDYFGMLYFDGTYLWWVKSSGLYQIDPRSLTTVAPFTFAGSSQSRAAFIGSGVVFTGGANGTINYVPRWSSQTS